MVLSAASPRAWQIRDVWAWNFVAEFDEFLATVLLCDGVILALDTEFPGFLCEDTLGVPRPVRYWALQQNVDMLQPIQLGITVADGAGVVQGTWTFNFWFDLATNLYTEESIAFLSAAGVDFPRHAAEGIHPAEVGWRLAASPIFGCHARSPQWLTFAGWYDWGYILKLLTNEPMPADVDSFDQVLAAYCPHRNELRDVLPRGSLDNLLAFHGIERIGAAHTAGSDALATLQLFMHLFPKVGVTEPSAGMEMQWKDDMVSMPPEFQIMAPHGVIGLADISSPELRVPAADVSRGKIDKIVAAARYKLAATTNDNEDEADKVSAEEEVVETQTEEIEPESEESTEESNAATIAENEEQQDMEETEETLEEPPRAEFEEMDNCAEAKPKATSSSLIVLTLSTALVLLQAVPTLACTLWTIPRQVEEVVLPWLYMRNVLSADSQRLLLALTTLFISVFGCFYFLF